MSTSGLESVLDRVEKVAATVSDGAAESERLGRLAPSVLDAIGGAGLFRMLVPEAHGGADLTLPESIEVLERVSACDASAGGVARGA